MVYIGEIGKVAVIQKKNECEIEWKIQEFDCLPNEEDTLCESPDFYFEDASWFLVMYPNGNISNNSVGYIHLNIYRRISSDPPITGKLSFALRTVNEQKVLEKHITEVFEGGKSHGIHRFLNRFEFDRRKSEFMTSGFFTVICTFKRLKSKGSATAQCPYCKEMFDTEAISSHQKKCVVKCPECLEDVLYQKWFDHECEISRAEDYRALCEDYKTVLLKGRNHDLVLKVGDSELRAHQDILSARSKVFDSMLSYDTKEKRSGVIDIPDCDPQAVEQFLSYIYSGKVDTLVECNMLQLYYVADKYDVKGLKEICCSFIKKSICFTNFCEVIQLALNHSDSTLLEHATEYFTDNMLDTMRTVEWQTFMKDNSTVANELTIKSVEKVMNGKK